jgi:hypothetical protein
MTPIRTIAILGAARWGDCTPAGFTPWTTPRGFVALRERAERSSGGLTVNDQPCPIPVLTPDDPAPPAT